MATEPCKPDNKYPPHPCPCPEIPGPIGPQGPVGPQGPPGTQGIPGSPGPGITTDTWWTKIGGHFNGDNPGYATPFAVEPLNTLPIYINSNDYRYKGTKILTGKNFTVKASSSDVGDDTVITILKNGVSTGMSVTVPTAVPNGTIFSDLVNSFTFTTDDDIVFRCTTSGQGNGNIFTRYCTFEAEG